MEGIKVIVPKHPLVKHWLSVLRQRDTPTSAFKNAMAELGRTLAYQATIDWLPTVTKVLQSPLDPAFVQIIDETQPILIVPILRGGLAFAEHATSLLPYTRTFHLGIARDDDKTLKPSVYLNMWNNDRGAKVEQIRVISAITCPYAIEKLMQKFPKIHMYVAAVDHVLNEEDYLIPGLGDAGDRCYGT